VIIRSLYKNPIKNIIRVSSSVVDGDTEEAPFWQIELVKLVLAIHGDVGAPRQ
jgi:hypothetical protein